MLLCTFCKCMQVVKREERVAFIGISNWALDPAKMNRGIMVRRGDPDVDELVDSARLNTSLLLFVDFS